MEYDLIMEYEKKKEREKNVAAYQDTEVNKEEILCLCIFSSLSAYVEESMFYCVPPSFKNNYKESCGFSDLSGGWGNPK